MRNLIIVVFFAMSISILILITNNDDGGFKKLLLGNSSCEKQFDKLPTETYKGPKSGIINSKDIKGETFPTHGKWKPGKRHNQTCDFILKAACCKKKQNLHFEFHEDRLNQIDAVKELRKILETKKMLLIGDSLMPEFFIGLSELLHIKTGTKDKYFCGLNCTIHPGHNGTVSYLKACLIELNEQEEKFNTTEWRIVSEEIIRREIPKYDVILFNQGQHHESRLSLSKSPIYFTNIGKMLHETVQKTSKQVIVRATLPQHFITNSGMGFYKDLSKTETGKCARKVPFPESHPTNYFLKYMARRFNFSFLDNFSIYYERGDLTFVRYTRKELDCTHHCYTPELIWPELVLLTQIIQK